MQPVVLAEVADELYALGPAEFIAARDERARQVRAAGQRDEAAAIKKLARPTASAWLVNQLARAAPEQMSGLYELGEALQEAQRTLAGDRLRELSAERRRVIHDLLPTAAELAARAGQPASAAVLGEVRATLEAALADAGARRGQVRPTDEGTRLRRPRRGGPDGGTGPGACAARGQWPRQGSGD